MPREELIDAFLLKVILGSTGSTGIAHLSQGLDARFPSPEVGLDAVAEVAACESAEADLGGKVVLAGAVDRGEVHGTEGAQEA